VLGLLLSPPPTSPAYPVATGPTGTPCPGRIRVGFVTDVAGLTSSVDAQGWAGVRAAAASDACVVPELRRSARPSDYESNLDQLAADSDLVVAGSFLLTEAVQAAASDHPQVHFVLVDPLVTPAPAPNLLVITFREDQAAFLAGALAAMVSRSRVVAGVYGLEGRAMRHYRDGFERGARAIDSRILVLGAYQAPSDGTPFGNPAWGARQANADLAAGADVIFGAGGLTGQGALEAAAAAGRWCIGAGTDIPASSCSLASAITRPDLAVESVVVDAAAGRWSAGVRTFGITQGAVGLTAWQGSGGPVTARMRERLQEITVALADGRLLDGN
jgi:basic membrane protein A